MDSLSLTKENRLFWLGRYAERTYTSIKYLIYLYDGLIDGKGIDYEKFCNEMGIPNVYTSGEDFCRKYTFDASSPFSIRTAAENMLGNGMVLRETISTETLSYLQLAVYNIQKAEVSDAVALKLQDVLDNIAAFRGCFDDYIASENVRNIIKTGRAVERLSLMLRLDYQKDSLQAELSKLLNRLYKTNLNADKDALAFINCVVLEKSEVDDKVLLNAVERLFNI